MRTEHLGALAGYLLLAYLVLNFVLNTRIREVSFAILNVAASGYLLVNGSGRARADVLACVLLLIFSFTALKLSEKRTALYPLALLTPILFVLGARAGLTPAFLGLSYLAFRSSYLAFEVQAGRVKVPEAWNYLSFALFPLTLFIGPISPYRFFESSLRSPSPEITPVKRSLARMAAGAVKLGLLAQVTLPMTFAEMWKTPGNHGFIDLGLSCIFSYLHLYLEFSGATDLIIGAAGLLDFKVKENFSYPLTARNLQEFWSRFHISLTEYMRDIVYLPGMVVLTRLLRGRAALATVFLLFLNFFLVGIWHGTGRNFLALGLLHGFGMVVFFIYSQTMKKMPSRVRELAGSPYARIGSTLLTFSFISFSSIFFENDWAAIQGIVATVRASLAGS